MEHGAHEALTELRAYCVPHTRGGARSPRSAQGADRAEGTRGEARSPRSTQGPERSLRRTSPAMPDPEPPASRPGRKLTSIAWATQFTEFCFSRPGRLRHGFSTCPTGCAALRTGHHLKVTSASCWVSGAQPWLLMAPLCTSKWNCCRIEAAVGQGQGADQQAAEDSTAHLWG